MKKEDSNNFYCLDMFPYPSGAGLHVGHPRGYTATDVYSRFKKLQGYNVLHPMGWDAFGLPAENYAIKNKIHPQKVVEDNVAKFKSQLNNFDLNYDWDKEINTTDPKYYRWTQFIFLKLFERGLAYEAETPINFCPSCKTGLANEEVIGGKCDRCSSTIERKNIRQWVLKITEYADRLLEDLDDLNWPEPIKEMQKNWIGRSEGSNIIFDVVPVQAGISDKIPDQVRNDIIEVYTTRADTLFGCTWVVLAPEHELINKLKSKISNFNEVQAYIESSRKKSDLERTELSKEKTGVELKGIKATNPVNGKEIAVWVADYVLGHYGTGAVMAVPAHDERDFEFAKKYDLPIISVVTSDFGQPLADAKNVTGPVVIGYDPKLRQYLSLINNNTGERWLVGGGLEDGESYKDAALRELKEEAGINDVSALIQLGDPTYSYYYNSDKKSNRRSFSYMYLAITDKEKQGNQSQEQHENFKVVWSDLDEIVKDLSKHSTNVDHWLESLKRVPDALKAFENGQDYKSPAFCDYGILYDSEEFSGLESENAKKRITEKLKESGHGDFTVNYKLRDWVFSRQRYWGEPIPIIHCENCGIVPVAEKDLPVILPHVENYEPTGDGTSPLSNESDPAIAKWLNTTCPKCGGKAKRETNTMPQWAGSCWYYIGYLIKNKDDYNWDREKIDPWLPVDLYVGGAEHAVLHLLYSRFWHKVLYDEKLVGTKEPFQKLISVGTILGIDGVKMSKSRGNTIDPDPLLKKFGSDALKMYELYIGPFSQMAKWNQNGIVGMYRFLTKAEKLTSLEISESNEINLVPINKAIKKVTDDIESFNFNTAISTLIETYDQISATGWDKNSVIIFLTLLYPFAPKTVTKISIALNISINSWPNADEKYLIDEKITIGVQVNGKIRDEIEINIEDSEAIIKDAALKSEKIKNWIPETGVKKLIYIKGKIISIVV